MFALDPITMIMRSLMIIAMGSSDLPSTCHQRSWRSVPRWPSEPAPESERTLGVCWEKSSSQVSAKHQRHNTKREWTHHKTAQSRQQPFNELKQRPDTSLGIRAPSSCFLSGRGIQRSSRAGGASPKITPNPIVERHG